MKSSQAFSLLRLPFAIILLALGYMLLGRLSLLLALPPGYTATIFPPAGLAIALCRKDLRLWPGVFLGAFLQDVELALNNQATLPMAIGASLLLATAASLQAYAGALYLRRYTNPAMDNGSDTLRFLFGMPFICLISASCSVPLLYWLGLMENAVIWVNWLAWWAGDLAGVLVCAPLVWIACARPRTLWWQRRYMVGLPLLFGCILSFSIYGKTYYWEQEQKMQDFKVHAQHLGDLLQARLAGHETYLQTIAISFDDDDHTISAIDFNGMTASHMRKHREISGMLWVGHLEQQENFEASYTIPDNQDITQQIRELLTPPIAKTTFSQLLRYGSVVKQAANGQSWLYVPIQPDMQQLRGRDPQQILGVLGIRIKWSDILQEFLRDPQFSQLELSLKLADGKSPPLFNSLSSKTTPGYRRTIEFGDQLYSLELGPNKIYLQNHTEWESWIVLAACLFINGMLGCMMLLVSGDKARINQLITERTGHLHEREARLQAILDHAADAILTIDDSGKLLSANNAACKLFDFTSQELTGMQIRQILEFDASWDMHTLHRQFAQRSGDDAVINGMTAQGHQLPLSLALSRVAQPGNSIFVCILRDLTEQMRSQEKIHHLAHHDPLTGLANRITLNLRLEQLLHLSQRHQQQVAVMFIDIDHFKKVNDSQGHQVGDMFLLEVAKRLQELVREADTIARFGGDEFVIILPEQDSADHVTLIATRIIDSLAAPFELGDLVLHSGASAGIAMFPGDGEDVKTLLRNADTAMYAAKAQGRGNFQFFSAEMNAATHQRLELEHRLWQALEQHEFELFLQPQFSLQNQQLIGAEALIRWRHPQDGLISPDRFIPVAEDSNLIQPLGEWVVQRAIEIVSGWQNGPLAHLRLALNLSARQCQSETLLPRLDQALLNANLSGRHLEMEITETAAMQDPERTRELLRQFRLRGIQVAIDDFGTGYSSLNYLKLFAIDRIKIDRSFVKDIETDANDAAIVNATIALAHSLGLEVIAEGVESKAQCEYLRKLSCDQVQGYLFSPPMPLDQFVSFALQQTHEQIHSAENA